MEKDSLSVLLVPGATKYFRIEVLTTKLTGTFCLINHVLKILNPVGSGRDDTFLTVWQMKSIRLLPVITLLSIDTVPTLSQEIS